MSVVCVLWVQKISAPPIRDNYRVTALQYSLTDE